VGCGQAHDGMGARAAWLRPPGDWTFTPPACCIAHSFALRAAVPACCAHSAQPASPPAAFLSALPCLHPPWLSLKPFPPHQISGPLQARLIDPKEDPYNVCLDDYEKGMTAARLDEIFEEARGALSSAFDAMPQGHVTALPAHTQRGLCF
jgi:hypothetical protein